MNRADELLSLVPVEQERFRRKLGRCDGSKPALQALVDHFIGPPADGPWGDWRDDVMAGWLGKGQKPPAPVKPEPPKPAPAPKKSGTQRSRR